MSRRFRGDLPLATRTRYGSFIFEVRLADGTCHDVLGDYAIDGFHWFLAGAAIDVTDEVVGWRETYGCGMARRALEMWRLSPESSIAQNGRDMALRRHIYFQRERGDGRPCCRSCRRYLREIESALHKRC